MIERMSNVEHRAFVPPHQKRRKVETGEGPDSQPGFSAGGSGMMGQHMKERREEYKKAATTQVEMVDLTSGSRSRLSIVMRTLLIYPQTTAISSKYSHREKRRSATAWCKMQS